MVDQELDELRREFLDEARQKIEEMETVLASPKTRDSLDRLGYLAHQLKGSGGSYGYQRISTSAAELEKAVEGAAPDAGGDVEPQIATHIRELRQAIDQAARDLGQPAQPALDG